MPSAAIGLGLAFEDARERAVGGLALGEGRRLVDRGPDEWVAKLEPVFGDAHEPGLFGVVECLRCRSELRRGAKDGRDLAAVVGGGDEHQRLRLLRQPMHAREECSLDAGAHRDRSQH